MKNQEVSRKLLRAISIGLAATLTLMPTATVFADDEPVADCGSGSESSSDSGSNSDSSSSSESSSSEGSSDSGSSDSGSSDSGSSDSGSDGGSSDNSSSNAGNSSESVNNEESDGSSKTDNGGNSDNNGSEGQGDSGPVLRLMATPNPESETVEDLLSDSTAALNLVESQKAVLDAANQAAAAANTNYGTSVTEGNESLDKVFTPAIDYANAKISEADAKAGSSLESAKADEASVAEASNKNYTDESAAQATKDDALRKISNAEEELSDITKKGGALEAAQNALDGAKDALDQANTELEEATEAKIAADEAVKAAEDKFENLLKENGIPYDKKTLKIDLPEGTNISDLTAEDLIKIIGDGTNGNSALKKALVKAEKAVEKARENAEEASDEYAKASEYAEKAKEDYEKAADSVEKASTEYDKSLAINKGAAEKQQEDLTNKIEEKKTAAIVPSEDLKSIWEQQKKVAEAAEQNDKDAYKAANDKLAYLMVKYYLSKDGISLSDADNVDANGNVKGFIKGEGNSAEYCIKVKYVVNGKTVEKDIIYRAYNIDGSRVDKANYEDLSQTDHIVIKANINNTNKFYTENDITRIKNQYNSEQKELEKLNQQLEDINKLLGGEEGYTPEKAVSAAKSVYDGAVEKYNNAQQTFYEQYKSEEEFNSSNQVIKTVKGDSLISIAELKKEIEQCQNVVSQAQSTDDYWKANRELAARLFAYQLYQDKGVTEVEIVRNNNGSLKYVSNNGNMNHYGIVKYKDASGIWHDKYYDYVAYFANGEQAEFSGFNGYSNIKYAFDSGKKAEDLHIVVYDKGEPTGQDSKGYTFASKGASYVDEDDYVNNTDRYSNALKELESLKTTQDNAEKVLNAVKDTSALKIVSETRDKVVAIAKELLQAKKAQAADEEKIRQLQEKYNEARKDYEAAKDNLEAVRSKVSAIQDSINKMNADLSRIHVQASVPKKKKSSDKPETSSDEEITESEAGPSDASPLTAVPASGVFTDGSLLTGGDAAAIAGGNTGAAAGGTGITGAATGNLTSAAGNTAGAESVFTGVTPGDSNSGTSSDSDLESSVLGERVAPIVQAAEDGTFTRDMLFNEDAKQIPAALWLLLFAFGAAGAGIYLKLKKGKIK